jgi:ketosteroid isomerase-like protein
MRTPREVSESYWAAECRRDIDAVMAHYHPDATYEDSGGLRRGHAEVREAYEESARDYPSLEVEIVREFTGTPDSSGLEFSAVLIDAAGRRFCVRGVNVVVVQDGKFVSVRSYEDPPVPEQASA